ncbi:hypothetical protein BDY19DRAFT_989156 [Irpex rosettiformis]|uniref:Uncharacterized protein n=1 Tax=Irpex rosettiformis TaxID=378272 RepID=A0ACB8UH59_9APHY|nr:hypothetical protein BDY19DRAFT_989156 [Irpex rosettiformis]
MSRFRPSRASSPLRSALKVPTIVAAEEILNNSRSSIASAPELAALSLEDIEFIDTVISKAGPSATTFLTIFKAYNDTLQERGMDPQHEVVYYGKLLKLGTLRGKNWGEKWEMVKGQQLNTGVKLPAKDVLAKKAPLPPPEPRSSSPLPSKAKILTRLTGTLKALDKDDDAFTLHSHQDDTDSDAKEAVDDELDVTPVPRHRTRTTTARRPNSSTLSTITNTVDLTEKPLPTSRTNPPALKPQRPFSRVTTAWDAETSDATVDTAQAPSSVPPSYGAATREFGSGSKPSSYAPLRALARAHTQTSSATSQASTSHAAPAAARAAILQARERRGSVLNEDDAWNKIKMARDEEEADRFREERLVERCFEVWKQGYQWIVTTNEQISQARDSLIVRLALHNWRAKTAGRRELYGRVAQLSDSRRLKAAIQLWRVKLKERKQAQWRNDMRMRMKTVHDRHEMKLKKDAWAKWRQLHRSRIAAQQYSQKLVLRLYNRWKTKLVALDRLENAAGQLIARRGKAQKERCWEMWKREMGVRNAERDMAERVGLRILSNAMGVWKRRLFSNQLADDHYNGLVQKHVFRRWQSAQGRTTALEHKAEQYRTRQDDVLIRAIWRIWKAHERGKLLERVKIARLYKQTLVKWAQRVDQQKQLEDRAIAFSLRSSSTLASGSLQKWRQMYTTHQNAQTFAMHYRSIQLRFKMMLVWRLQLRAKLKLLKQAKLVEKYFIVRNAWKIWQEKLAEKRREQKLKVFEGRLVRSYFREWVGRAQAQRSMKLSEESITQRVDLRIVSEALTRWTNRVADMKFRELEVSSQADRKGLTIAFKKWKNVCIRHVEELSLMESYQDVKREENMRKMFYRWHSAARKSRHRRLLLQQKEEELKMTIIAGAWDKWRERYLAIRLQPVADAFLVQNQQNLVFRAFGIWHSKTNSLPAVRFHASHLKARFWRTWRDAMPRVLQAREARETDRASLLSKAFGRWMQAYKTKIELKAVARARYLRLPTAAPRQSGASSRSITASKPTTASASSFPRPAVRSTKPLSDASGPSSAPPPPPVTAGFYKGRLGIASLLSERSRSPERISRPRLSTASPTRPKLSTRASTVRDTSPARTTTSSSRYYSQRQNDGFLRVPVSVTAPSSAAGDTDEIGRSKLWQQLRGLQLRSRPPTDLGSLASREPP